MTTKADDPIGKANPPSVFSPHKSLTHDDVDALLKSAYGDGSDDGDMYRDSAYPAIAEMRENMDTRRKREEMTAQINASRRLDSHRDHQHPFGGTYPLWSPTKAGRQGLVLQASKTNPAVKRWVKMGLGDKLRSIMPGVPKKAATVEEHIGSEYHAKLSAWAAKHKTDLKTAASVQYGESPVWHLKGSWQGATDALRELEPDERHALHEVQQFHSKYPIMKSGHGYAVGTVRKWGGVDYQKQSDGDWKQQSKPGLAPGAAQRYSSALHPGNYGVTETTRRSAQESYAAGDAHKLHTHTLAAETEQAAHNSSRLSGRGKGIHEEATGYTAQIGKVSPEHHADLQDALGDATADYSVDGVLSAETREKLHAIPGISPVGEHQVTDEPTRRASAAKPVAAGAKVDEFAHPDGTWQSRWRNEHRNTRKSTAPQQAGSDGARAAVGLHQAATAAPTAPLWTPASVGRAGLQLVASATNPNIKRWKKAGALAGVKAAVTKRPATVQDAIGSEYHDHLSTWADRHGTDVKTAAAVQAGAAHPRELGGAGYHTAKTALAELPATARHALHVAHQFYSGGALHKARESGLGPHGYPAGAIREWRGVKVQKQADGSWHELSRPGTQLGLFGETMHGGSGKGAPATGAPGKKVDVDEAALDGGKVDEKPKVATAGRDPAEVKAKIAAAKKIMDATPVATDKRGRGEDGLPARTLDERMVAQLQSTAHEPHAVDGMGNAEGKAKNVIDDLVSRWKALPTHHSITWDGSFSRIGEGIDRAKRLAGVHKKLEVGDYEDTAKLLEHAERQIRDVKAAAEKIADKLPRGAGDAHGEVLSRIKRMQDEGDRKKLLAALDLAELDGTFSQSTASDLLTKVRGMQTREQEDAANKIIAERKEANRPKFKPSETGGYSYGNEAGSQHIPDLGEEGWKTTYHHPLKTDVHSLSWAEKHAAMKDPDGDPVSVVHRISLTPASSSGTVYARYQTHASNSSPGHMVDHLDDRSGFDEQSTFPSSKAALKAIRETYKKVVEDKPAAAEKKAEPAADKPSYAALMGQYRTLERKQGPVDDKSTPRIRKQIRALLQQMADLGYADPRPPWQASWGKEPEDTFGFRKYLKSEDSMRDEQTTLTMVELRKALADPYLADLLEKGCTGEVLKKMRKAAPGAPGDAPAPGAPPAPPAPGGPAPADAGPPPGVNAAPGGPPAPSAAPPSPGPAPMDPNAGKEDESDEPSEADEPDPNPKPSPKAPTVPGRPSAESSPVKLRPSADTQKSLAGAFDSLCKAVGVEPLEEETRPIRSARQRVPLAELAKSRPAVVPLPDVSGIRIARGGGMAMIVDEGPDQRYAALLRGGTITTPGV